MTEFLDDSAWYQRDAAGAALPIVFWGAGGQSLVLRELLRSSPYSLQALLADLDEPSRFDVPLIAGEPRIRTWIAERATDVQYRFAVAIGGSHGALRLEKHGLLKGMGLVPQTLIHPTAALLSDRIGEGCQILARSVIGVEAALGASVIVNTSASIDHECHIGDGVHVGPGATLAGRITVGERTFIGAGATVGPDVTIAADCIIGAGAVVVRDITTAGTYVGVPARQRHEKSS